MIPTPKYRNDRGSCNWQVGDRLDLWWFSHTRRWALTVDAGEGAVTASVSVDLGAEAPAALLLLAHRRIP